MQVDTEETHRLRALRSYEIVDTSHEDSFDRIARLAKLALQVPISLISFVDEDRQWFKARIGLDVSETPRCISFCTHTIRNDAPLVVQDAASDPRFRDNPLVTGEPHIRFYCGVPLVTPDGYKLGTICTIDNKPRDVSEEQVSGLRDLAKIVIQELELRRAAATDSLTGLMTRRSFESEVRSSVGRDPHRGLALVIADVDRFKQVNDTYGHAAGDTVLKAVADLCRNAAGAADFACRLGGEEFAIALVGSTLEGAFDFAERLRRRVQSLDVTHAGRTMAVTSSFGVAAFEPADVDFKATLARADEALYRAKRGGRNRVEVSFGAAPAAVAAA